MSEAACIYRIRLKGYLVKKGQRERAGTVGTLTPRKRQPWGRGSGGVKRRWRPQHQRKWQRGEVLENKKQITNNEYLMVVNIWDIA